jgi:hypothetical protein
MIEALFAVLLAAGALSGVAGVLDDEWNGLRCSVLTFEAGHDRLVGGNGFTARGLLGAIGAKPGISVTENDETVVAEGRCGRARERIEFVKLEAAHW